MNGPRPPTTSGSAGADAQCSELFVEKILLGRRVVRLDGGRGRRTD